MKATTRRIYVPVDRPALVALLDDGSLRGPLDVHTVTPTVREAFGGDDVDEEDLEYAALWSAADAARAGQASPGRVVVVAADVSDADLAVAVATAPEAAYVVRLDGPLLRRVVVALHVAEADDGDDEELAWYDASELADVVRSWPVS